ncbi:hypothetical protein WDZ16_07605 [Pseudokineococcus marinus]|uniref:Tfp pilus assembly protein PilO n=1 Tax=Pseudokineococcus marinus TaxID=351215 RepID=A0A849BHX3_9ACTN|nr:hypothetical protein [Pseudokineococcus marinus]NNH22760.1 hypothetical protein [Pseudokineococcus marinus]
MRLTRTTAWVGGAALLGLVLVAAAWLLLVGPRQQLAADLREQTASTAAQNDLLTAQVRRLEEQLGDVPTTRAEVAALREQVPADAQLPALLRQVTELSDLAGAQLTGVTPTEPADVPTDAAAAVPTEAPADASADGTAATSPAPTDPAVPGGVQVVPVALTATGSFAQLQELLRLVQVELPRALLVRSVSLTAGEGEGALQLSVSADALVLPTTPQEEQLVALAAAGATAADGATGTAASPEPAPAPAPAPTAGATDPSAASAAAPPTTEDPL